MKKTGVFICVGALALLAGCSMSSPEELERLMKEDPAFKRMVAARDQVNLQTLNIRQDLVNRKKILDTQIEKLRNEYDAYAKIQNQKIEQLKLTVEANRQILGKEIEAADQLMNARITELQGYQKTLADVKKVLREGKGLSLSAQEKQKWEDRILLLSEKIRPLSEEIQELRLQIRLKKQKMGFLR